MGPSRHNGKGSCDAIEGAKKLFKTTCFGKFLDLEESRLAKY